MNFFFDANMSRRYAVMLSGLCEGFHTVVHITDHPDFRHNNVYSGGGILVGNNTPDVEWIGRLGGSPSGWKVVSGESDIVDTAHERAALLESGLTLFSMDRNWNRAAAPEQAWEARQDLGRNRPSWPDTIARPLSDRLSPGSDATASQS